MSDSLDKMLEHYEEVTNPIKRLSGEDLLKKYFNPRSDVETFRVLEAPEGEKLVEEAHFHSVKINGKWTKVYCVNKNDGKRCAMCEKSKAILDKQKKITDDMSDEEKELVKEKNKEIFKVAMQYSADKFYIIKGIDRGATKDGVKFWRFKHNSKKEGIYDKMISAVRQYKSDEGKNFSSNDEGCDLNINTVEDKTPSGIKYKKVTSILPRKTSKLSSDPAEAERYIEEGKKLKWKDVFLPKKVKDVIDAELFLELLAEGNAPYYVESEKRWFVPNHPELESKANERSANLEVNTSTSSDDDDDLDEISKIVDETKTVKENKISTNTTNVTHDDESSDKEDEEDDDFETDDLPF
ncbi:MAG: hypothetical protein ACOC33_01345 [bacterium]